jgi:hypothetical protein
MNIIERFLSLLAWVQIMIAPFSGGVIIGFLIWGKYRTTTGLITSISIAVAGLVTGILWAEKVRKKSGTLSFMSKVSSSHELDHPEENEKESN